MLLEEASIEAVLWLVHQGSNVTFPWMLSCYLVNELHSNGLLMHVPLRHTDSAVLLALHASNRPGKYKHMKSEHTGIVLSILLSDGPLAPAKL